MRRALTALGLLAALVALLMPDALATGSATCTPSAASSPRVSCPAVDPNQALYDQLRARLGGDLARALSSQQELTAALNQSAASQQALSTQIATQESKISGLEAQIAQLESQIAITQSNIDAEQAQIASLARAIYRQPDSLLVLMARTGNLHDALVAAADMVVAGQRAHATEARLEADLATLQSDWTARQADLDHENTVLDQLNTSLTNLNDQIAQQNTIADDLQGLMTSIQSTSAGIVNQAPDVTAGLASLLEQQEQNLIQQAYQAAWRQAQVGAGIAMVSRTLPAGTTLPGLVLSWPIEGARITQPFGPSAFLLEPPLGPYPHFHTGIDLAAPLGTVVTAAADGVVVAVAHTSVGYGNYVIIAHGGGIMTLYGHLLQTDVQVGDSVHRGQHVGLEGMSGLATGPHVHFELRVNNEVTDPMPYLLPMNGPTTP